MTRTTSPASTETIDSCRARIQALYDRSPSVCLNLALSHSRIVQGAPATLIGVYKHVFCVEESSCGTPQRHTFTYADLLTWRVEIQPADQQTDSN